jgi:serine/threonine protein kinase
MPLSSFFSSIIYRDLKPDNVGFDVRGDVKIFDFGLAKELDLSKKLDDGTYNLTADTGSLRYMAPEGKAADALDQRVAAL